MQNSPDRHKRELVNICECWKSRMTMGRAAMTRAVMTRALRLAVHFLFSILFRPSRWEVHHLLCFAILAPPKMIRLSRRFLLRCLSLPLAPAGLRSVKVDRSNTEGRRSGVCTCGSDAGLGCLEPGSAPKTNNLSDSASVLIFGCVGGLKPKLASF